MNWIDRKVAGMIALLLTAWLPGEVLGQTFRLDSLHSFIAFECRHLELTNAWGLAVGPAGTFTIDPVDPGKSSFQVEVRANSIITGNSKRDDDLRGPDMLDARQFPNISFKSTLVKKEGDNYQVTGDFTLHGVTKPLTVTIIKTGEIRGGQNVGFATTFTIKRTDFGVSGYLNLAGDEVKIHVNLEGQRQ